MKTFTLRQAESMIPLLRAEMRRLRPAYLQLKERLCEIADENELPVYDPSLREMCADDDFAGQLVNIVEESLALFEEFGVECKSIEEGLFDFPCLLEDRIVYLCWKESEDSIDHWHELDTGFPGRRPLLEATRRSFDVQKQLLN